MFAITTILLAPIKLMIGKIVDINVISMHHVCTGHSTTCTIIAISITTVIIVIRVTLTAYQDITRVMYNDIINI